jgi:hypothetical protein
MDIRRSDLPNPSERLKRIEASARGIADVLGRNLPPGWGFGLMFFEFKGPESTWISNCNRQDMVKALRELADRLELDRAGGPVAPFSQ